MTGNFFSARRGIRIPFHFVYSRRKTSRSRFSCSPREAKSLKYETTKSWKIERRQLRENLSIASCVCPSSILARTSPQAYIFRRVEMKKNLRRCFRRLYLDGSPRILLCNCARVVSRTILLRTALFTRSKPARILDIALFPRERTWYRDIEYKRRC